jgi:serine/threonine protein kinase
LESAIFRPPPNHSAPPGRGWKRQSDDPEKKVRRWSGMSLAGTTIDQKYLILNQLGEGGMSFVYHALNVTSQTKVVVKMMKEKITSSYLEDFIRFKREIEIISKFNHPNIVKAYDAGEYHNYPYLVTEFLDGMSLAEYLRTEQTGLKIEKTVEIIKQVSEALNYVHANGVIHRDLKPVNIFGSSGNCVGGGVKA